jgi:DNA-binding XRE family transcriptional regulator
MEDKAMKKAIFDQEMENEDFKALYKEIACKLGIGEQIAKYRHKRKMTQQELAEKVHTSRTAIARYESGNYTNFNLMTLARIARALDTNLKVNFVG